jgi:hypothetical protein
VLYAEDAEAVQEQLSLSHEHRNKLTEIVREARSAWRQLMKTHCGLDLEQLETGRDAILEEINATKALRPLTGGPMLRIAAPGSRCRLLAAHARPHPRLSIGRPVIWAPPHCKSGVGGCNRDILAERIGRRLR